MALSELVKDLIIKFQPACNVAANKIKKKIFDSLILIINFFKIMLESLLRQQIIMCNKTDNFTISCY
jgi:hypothetical protein